MATFPSVAFIGGGNMANALVSGMLAQGCPTERVHVVEVLDDAAEIRIGVPPRGHRLEAVLLQTVLGDDLVPDLAHALEDEAAGVAVRVLQHVHHVLVLEHRVAEHGAHHHQAVDKQEGRHRHQHDPWQAVGQQIHHRQGAYATQPVGQFAADRANHRTCEHACRSQVTSGYRWHAILRIEVNRQR